MHQEVLTPVERRRRERRRVYKSARWRRVRLAALARSARRSGAGAPRCEECGGPDTRLEVHHVVPLVRGGAPFALSNLKVLCRPCHWAQSKPKYQSPGERAWAQLLEEEG